MKKVLILALCIAFSNCNKFDSSNVVEKPSNKTASQNSNSGNNSSNNQNNNSGNSNTNNQNNNSGNNSSNNQNNNSGNSNTNNQNNNSGSNSSNNQNNNSGNSNTNNQNNNSGNNSSNNQNNNSGNSNSNNQSNNSGINNSPLGRYLVQNGYDKNNNGILDENEIKSIQSLDLSGKNLSGNILDGIEYLIDLEELNVSNNNFTELTIKGEQLININLSNNKLVKLDISGVGVFINGAGGQFNATGNRNLTCIKANANQINSAKGIYKNNWKKDANCNFDTNC